MNKLQQLIDRVSELRFLKVRERQVNKFNRLLLKKEGNITWVVSASTPGNRVIPRQAALVLFPLRQVVLRQRVLIPRL